MKGTVCGFSKCQTRFAALTDYGYIVFDMEYGEVSVRDVITGNLDDHGSQVLMNQTTGQKFSAYIEAIQAEKEFAESLLQSI